LFNDVG
jgi:tetratricopeptide (TPR) repeat protein